MLAVAASSTAAAQTIDNDQSTPVQTSTANNGAAGDITITENGAIAIAAGTDITAVTIDSDNSLFHEGEITLDAIDGGIGVLMEGGLSGDLISSGLIELTDGYDREDTDDDDDLDGPYAIGTSRTGVLLDGGGAFTGDILLEPGAAIVVEGNESAGVVLMSPLLGSFVNDGVITVTGDEAVGVGVQGGIAGDLFQSGPITAQGVNARGLSVIGDIDGAFSNDGSIVSTGFASTSITNYADPDDLEDDDTPIDERIDAEDLLDNTSGVSVGGSIAQGFLNNGIIDDFIDEEEAEDETKDTIEDFDENRPAGTISSYGSGPALIISPDLDPARSEDIVLGTVVETVRDTLDDDEDDNVTETLATFAYDYGFINRGSIFASGLNVGFDATALRIEGSDDGLYQTIVTGGIENTGTVRAVAFEADAHALSLGSGAIIGRLDNSGIIDADVFSEFDNTATGLLIEDGADLSEIFNTGTISASSVGNQTNAYAIRDLSGGLLTIENQGLISASASLDGEEDMGAAAIAIDLSNHSALQSAIVLQTQRQPVDDINGDDEIDLGDVASPAIVGDILLGAGDDIVDVQAGDVIGDLRLGEGNNSVQFTDADFAGDVRGGGGTDRFSITGGVFDGAIDLGAGDDFLNVAADAEFVGDVSDADGSLQIEITDATFDLTNDDPLSIRSLTVNGTSTLSITTDANSANASAPRITVSETATLSADTTVNATIENFTLDALELTLIDAGALNVEDDNISGVVVGAPAIYNETISFDATSLNVTLAPKSPDDLGLNANESAAFASFLSVAADNDDVGSVLTSFDEESDLTKAYRNVLPDYTDAMTRFLSEQTNIATGAMSTRLDQVRAGRDGFWIHAVGAYAREKASVQSTGYSGQGVTFQSGYDRNLTRNFTLGAAGAIRIVKFTPNNDVNGEIETVALDLNVYSAVTLGGLQVDVSGVVGKGNFYSDRSTTLANALEIYESDWDGFYYAGGARLGYEAKLGQFYARPTVSIDYFTLSQDAHVDAAGGDDLLALFIEDADTSRTTGAAVLRLGRRIGRSGSAGNRNAYALRATTSERVFVQEIYGGYRTEIDSQSYQTIASFGVDGDAFTIFDPTENEDALLAGFSIGAVGDGYALTVGYDGEFAGDYMSHKLGATFGLSF